MSDLISRQAAIEALHTCFMDGFDEDKWWNSTHVLAAIEGLPPALPEPSQVAKDIARIVENEQDMRVIAQPERIKGRWISADAIFGGEPFYCSECGENTRDTVMGKPRWNFCPNCGAEMEETT